MLGVQDPNNETPNSVLASTSNNGRSNAEKASAKTHVGTRGAEKGPPSRPGIQYSSSNKIRWRPMSGTKNRTVRVIRHAKASLHHDRPVGCHESPPSVAFVAQHIRRQWWMSLGGCGKGVCPTPGVYENVT
ncbi:hypothetical protein B0H19DRAFT_1062122 [Mycena capillaripes]|nr:hypothetical protein B0H19DRAFT_1062122 [Mycena capillaripes]